MWDVFQSQVMTLLRNGFNREQLLQLGLGRTVLDKFVADDGDERIRSTEPLPEHAFITTDPRISSGSDVGTFQPSVDSKDALHMESIDPPLASGGVVTPAMEQALLSEEGNGSSNAAPNGALIDKEPSTPEMDVDSDDDFITMVDGAWETVKANPLLVEPSPRSSNAIEADAASQYVVTRPKPFIQQRQISYVIDLSDSEDGDHGAVVAMGGSHVQTSDATIAQRMAQIELQKRMLEEKLREVAARRKKRSQSDGHGPIRTEMREIRNGESPSKPRYEATQSAEAQASFPTSREGGKGGSQVEEDHQAFSPSELSLVEASVIATQAHISGIEEEMDRVFDQISTRVGELREAQCSLVESERKLNEVKELIGQQRAVVQTCSQATQDLASRLSLLHKEITTKRLTLVTLQEGLSGKGRELLSLPSRADAPGGTSKPGMAETNTHPFPRADENHILERQVMDAGSPAHSLLTSLVKEFLHDGYLSVESLPSMKQGTSLEQLHRLLHALKWTEEPTAEPLSTFPSGILRHPSEIATVRDILSNVTAAASDNDAIAEASASPTRRDASLTTNPSTFVPYTSTLQGFRSFRIDDDSGRRHGSLTYSTTLDPKQQICHDELEGGTCLNAKCTAQHLRDVRRAVPGSSDAVHSAKEPLLIANNFERNNAANLTLNATPLQNGTNPQAGIATEQTSFTSLRLPSTGQLATGLSSHIPIGDMAPVLAGASDGQLLSSDGLLRKVIPQAAVITSGLVRMLGAEHQRPSRYYEMPSSDIDAELLARRHPRNVQYWLRYAVDMLPEITIEDLQRSSSDLNKSLHVLSRALQANRNSEVLWSFYMELYSRRASSDEVRASFHQALDFVPCSERLLWQWYSWEATIDGKTAVLQGFLRSVLLSSQATLPSVMDAVLQLCKHSLQSEDRKAAESTLRTFLTVDSPRDFTDSLEHLDFSQQTRHPEQVIVHQTLAYRILSESDACQMWLHYIHLIAFGRFPEGMTVEFPYDYLTSRTHFQISWSKPAWPSNTGLICRLCRIFDQLVSSWCPPDSTHCPKSIPIIVRNYCMLLKQTGADLPTLKTILKPLSQRYPNESYFRILEVHLLQAFGSSQQALSSMVEVASKSPSDPAEWNYAVNVALTAGKIEEAVQSLIRCARAQFVEVADRSDRPEDALILYELVLFNRADYHGKLALHPVRPRAESQEDVFLWLNYLILLVLEHASTETLQRVFTDAIESVKDTTGKQLLWLDYLQCEVATWRPDTSDKSWLRGSLAVAARALGDERMSLMESAILTAKADDTDFTKPVALKVGFHTDFPIFTLLTGPKYCGFARDVLQLLLPALMREPSAITAILMHPQMELCLSPRFGSFVELAELVLSVPV
ncbi:Zinc finger C3H1 domain-containing protein [Gaertneriomyces sp. JEL0708]|nr:Zinc finger C3H1 domain-containing protein [Gaertneriomyces sp. JEL0708]